MIETKRTEMELAQQKEQEARAEITEATEAIKTATAEMNLEAYEAATARRNKAKTAANMYAAKAEQIRQQEYVTEEESDRVIDQLLEHENKLYKAFLDAISDPLARIRRCCKAYSDGIDETEKLIRKWTQEIHANYRSAGTTYANGTNRADTPQPVHAVAFTGHRFYKTAQEFIERADTEIIAPGE
jgi:vacuolar-type H+-ATPase subunit E/Vma4